MNITNQCIPLTLAQEGREKNVFPHEARHCGSRAHDAKVTEGLAGQSHGQLDELRAEGFKTLSALQGFQGFAQRLRLTAMSRFLRSYPYSVRCPMAFTGPEGV